MIKRNIGFRWSEKEDSRYGGPILKKNTLWMKYQSAKFQKILRLVDGGEMWFSQFLLASKLRRITRPRLAI